MAQVKADPNGQSRLVVDPMENILIGSSIIMQYMGISSVNTLYQWVELYGFPAIKRPDGMWMSSMTSIDQWIFMAAELDLERRPHSRGHSQRLELAKERIERRIEATQGMLKRPTGPVMEQDSRAAFDEATKNHPERIKRTEQAQRRKAQQSGN